MEFWKPCAEPWNAGAAPSSLCWIVAHNEGISVAAELLDLGKKVHLTVHDDPFATWIRSDRYRLFRPLLSRTFPRILRAAQSVDVTSWGMRNLYRQKYGVNCFALYLHVPQFSLLNVAPEPDYLTVGHIGTLYHPQPFRCFIAACKRIAASASFESAPLPKSTSSRQKIPAPSNSIPM